VVDFTNILRPAFAAHIPKAQKIQASHQFFEPLGSTRLKAACKRLVKSTLGIDREPRFKEQWG